MVKHTLLKVIVLFTILMIPTQYHIFATNHTTQQPIRGIYVNAANTNGPKFDQLLALVNHSDLNAMVIDIKDDEGRLTFLPAKKSPYYYASHPFITNPAVLIQTLNKKHIYPIARIVTFKDSKLAMKNPNWSFNTPKGIWRNPKGDAFTNPFLKEVWDYNIGIAIEAAKLGFKEIQFDYVRFPEKFETFEGSLSYPKIRFGDDPARSRVAAITSFVQYAHQQLKPYHVKMSVDVFGNSTVIPEAGGIGQNFSEIAKNVDVISAMIYPSHWSKHFGIEKPDLDPYRLVKEYTKLEKTRLATLNRPPVSRPWLQDFTATWLGQGNFKVYRSTEVEDQIRALHSEGIDEYLLWNSRNQYSPNVDYTPF
jgi:hypothetical protein